MADSDLSQRVRLEIEELLDFRLPTPEEEEALKVLRTYGSYAKAIEFLSRDAELVKLLAIRKSAKFHGIQRRHADERAIVESLNLAWAAEEALGNSLNRPELALASYEAPRQAYYACFHGMRALFAAAGDEVPPQHAATLKETSNWLLQRSELFSEPWVYLLDGDPDRKPLSFCGAHEAIEIADVNALASFNEFSATDLVAKFLKTTRQRQIHLAVESEKKHLKVSRAPRGLKAILAGKVPVTSILHGLYRLRRRNDYEDAMSILLGAISEEEARGLCSSLVEAVDAWLQNVELLVTAYAGLDSTKTALQRWSLYKVGECRPNKRFSVIGYIL